MDSKNIEYTIENLLSKGYRYDSMEGKEQIYNYKRKLINIHVDINSKRDSFIDRGYIMVENVSDIEMSLKYVDVDLNDDGLKDKIVIIRSPIHSGSQGDMLEILLNNSGTYNKIYTGIFRLYSQEWEAIGSVIILKGMNNRLKNIKFKTDKGSIIIRYDGNLYL